MKLKAGYVDVTDETIAALKLQQKRTGVGPQKLLRGKALPVGLSSTTIYNWINKVSATAKKEYVENVFGLYSNLPTVEKIELSEKAAEQLKSKIKETGLSLSKLLSFRDDVPEGLKARPFYLLLHRTGKRKYNKIWGDYVLDVCNEYIEKKEGQGQVKKN